MAGDAFGALPSICLLVVSMMMMVMMMLMVMMMVVMVVMLIKILSTLAPVSVKGTKQNDQYFTLVQIRFFSNGKMRNDKFKNASIDW